MSKKIDYERIVRENPDRVRIMRNYARDTRWKLLHQRHTSKFGLSYEQTKEFGKYILGSSVEESHGKQQVEIEHDGGDLLVSSKGQRIRTLDQLLAAAEVDQAKWVVRSFKVNTWEVASKGSNGGVEVTPVWQVKASLEPKHLMDARPVIPTEVIKRKPPKPRRKGILRALFIPDSQHGFRWTNDFKYLDPLHDRKAIDAAVQLAQAFQPDVIVMLGDMADLAPWSTRWPAQPDMRQTTQPTLAELHWQLKQFRLACPRAQMVYMAGNHEERMNKAVIQNLEEAALLRNVDDAPDKDPVISIRRFLALDALDIEYVGPYNSEWWLWDRIRINHGFTVKSGGGATVAARVKASGHSEVFGHIHRFELAQRTVRGPKGSRCITAMSPGCLCRVDGAVPGVTKTPDWQQGVGIAYADVDKEIDHLSLIPIIGGNLVFDGRVFTGIDRAEEIAKETGFDQIVKP